MQLLLRTDRIEDYDLFLRIKRLPTFRFTGHVAEFPDEYAELLGIRQKRQKATAYTPPEWLFDYQKDITRLAIQKRKFCLFMDCGLGKTPIHLEFARHAFKAMRRRNCLIVAPLMVVRQELQEIEKFYGGGFFIEQITASGLQRWLNKGVGIGITNYEAITDDLTSGRLGCLVLSESSMLKSHYGKWGTKLIELGRGLEWKLCETGTPAPNDRIEYANHAVFMDAYPTVNAFLARFFVNRGQTDNRWELKAHALKPFYTALSHWSIFVSNPATYGWSDNCDSIPPIHVHIHDVDLTDEQSEVVVRHTGELFASAGGITSRSTLGQIAKGNHKGRRLETHKPEYIRDWSRSGRKSPRSSGVCSTQSRTGWRKSYPMRPAFAAKHLTRRGRSKSTPSRRAA